MQITNKKLNIAKIKNISILGAAESGVGAAILAKKNNFQCFISDINNIRPKNKIELIRFNIDFEEKNHNLNKICRSDLIIKSPGIKPNSYIIKKIKENKIPIISDIEFAFQFCNKPIIAITGTNGKSTCTTFIYEILKNCNLKVSLSGNIGISFTRVCENDVDFHILETSSAQLDNIIDFKPNFAILLNISKDHIDYHSSYQNYISSKMKILDNMDQNDTIIYNYDDKILYNFLKNPFIKSKLIPFSLKKILKNNGLYIKNDKINYKNYNINLNSILSNSNIKILNVLPSIIVGNELNISQENVLRQVLKLKPIEHRIEFIKTIKGIEFYNDSKATNIDATLYAIKSFKKNIIWIAGGVDKGNDYSKAKEYIKQKVKQIICIGKDNTKIKKEFGDIYGNILEVNDLKEAIEQALFIAKKNYIVLLSPACASFDKYKNYKERGNIFKKYVLTN